MKRLLTCIALCVVCLTLKADDLHGVASEALTLWQGVPVTLVKAEPGEDGDTFSIIKREPNDENEYGTVEIVSGTDAGIMYGVYTILRAQTMGDGCLCRTIPGDECLTVAPRFSRRAVQCDWLEIKTICESGRIPEFAAECAKSHLNMLSISRPDTVSECEYDRLMKLIKPCFMKYHIYICDIACYGPNVVLFSIETDNDDIRYMAADWAEKMVEAEARDVDTVMMSIRHIEGNHPFDAANLHAFGRMSFDRQATPYLVAYEWLAMSFTENPLFVLPMREIMINGSETDFNTKRKAFETYINN